MSIYINKCKLRKKVTSGVFYGMYSIFFLMFLNIDTTYPVAEFIDPDWGDKVNSGTGLSYRPARRHGLAGRYDKPKPELTLSPSHGSKNSATVCLSYKSGLFIPFHLVNTSYPPPLPAQVKYFCMI
jgi:hypothetical protein